MDILALELIDEIIGHVDEKDGLRRFDLRTCSLVCRFWVPSSQRRLFHRIKFKYPLWQYRELHAEIRQLDQLLLNSPHIANYIRVLKLPDMTYVSRFTDVRGLDEPLSPLLPKLTQVQKIEIHGLAWNDLRLERDLRQSLCKVLELPSVSFVCIYGAQFNGMDDFMNFISHARSLTCLLLYPDAMWMSQNPVALDDTQADDNKHTERCCISRLDMRFRCNNPGSVSWLLGPRSHLDVSHIHTLHIYLPDEAKDDSFNRLLCTIGSSLKHLCISLPCLSW
ncbi:hypothetical protein JB92DRAFT_2940018 [Gautieria morchelliformis]|nr:hypothetical protein JB92DRAFT_2940018 [Gautieria morchelliformis]